MFPPCLELFPKALSRHGLAVSTSQHPSVPSLSFWSSASESVVDVEGVGGKEQGTSKGPLRGVALKLWWCGWQESGIFLRA